MTTTGNPTTGNLNIRQHPAVREHQAKQAEAHRQTKELTELLRQAEAERREVLAETGRLELLVEAGEATEADQADLEHAHDDAQMLAGRIQELRGRIERRKAIDDVFTAKLTDVYAQAAREIAEEAAPAIRDLTEQYVLLQRQTELVAAELRRIYGEIDGSRQTLLHRYTAGHLQDNLTARTPHPNPLYSPKTESFDDWNRRVTLYGYPED